MRRRSVFEGLAGRVVAEVMARSNHDSELEAIELLDPSAGDVVVAIGIGPGVGVRALAARVRTVVGVDPSQAMIDDASRRCRDGIDAGVVQLHRTDASALPVARAGVDGAIAVNSIQLWDPLDGSLAEVARVLRPGGRLVTLTHDWAIRRSCGLDVEDWVGQTTEICASHGLVAPETRRARAEGGRSVVFAVRRDES